MSDQVGEPECTWWCVSSLFCTGLKKWKDHWYSPNTFSQGESSKGIQIQCLLCGLLGLTQRKWQLVDLVEHSELLKYTWIHRGTIFQGWPLDSCHLSIPLGHIQHILKITTFHLGSQEFRIINNLRNHLVVRLVNICLVPTVLAAVFFIIKQRRKQIQRWGYLFFFRNWQNLGYASIVFKAYTKYSLNGFKFVPHIRVFHGNRK